MRGGRGSGAAMATSPSAKPEQIQLTTEYLRPTAGELGAATVSPSGTLDKIRAH